MHNGEQKKAEQLWTEALKKHSSNLLLLRTINKLRPDLLGANPSLLSRVPHGNRVAIVLTGELRCFEQSKSFFTRLRRDADLFVCTSPSFSDKMKLLPTTMAEISKKASLPVGSMHQWEKLDLALKMVRMNEKNIGTRYSHILKLRSDYYHTSPQYLLNELVNADGLICASDKVFGGRRELMLLFEGFYKAISGSFDQQEEHYWPINVEPILCSDDSSKWYGMAFPKALVGEPKSVECLRQILKDGGSYLANALLEWKASGDVTSKDYIRFFRGHHRFASEICFARFLNFNAIQSHACPGLTGFLRNNRLPI